MPILIAIIIIATVAFIYANKANAFEGNMEITEKIKAFARCIAEAEGYGRPNAIPTITNNPGDLVLGDKGLGVLGRENITKFPDPTSGWNALYHEIALIVYGKSHVYNLDMTISDMAYHWTSTEQDAWSENVATCLGVTRDTTLRSILT